MIRPGTEPGLPVGSRRPRPPVNPAAARRASAGKEIPVPAVTVVPSIVRKPFSSSTVRTRVSPAKDSVIRALVEATVAPGKTAAAMARETEAKLAWERLMRRAEEAELEPPVRILQATDHDL